MPTAEYRRRHGTRRQAADPTFVTRVVQSLPQADPESAGFLLSTMFDDAGARAANP